MYDELLKLDNQLCFRLYKVSRKMTRAYQPFLGKYNLTYPQYIVLLVLFEYKKIDFKDLSELVDLKTGTLTPLINNLIKQGYIQKTKNKEDMRKIDITLTEKGIQLEKEIVDVPIGLFKKLQVTVEMYQTLVKELDLLSDLLDDINEFPEEYERSNL